MLQDKNISIGRENKYTHRMIKDKLSLNDPWYQLIMEMLESTIYSFSKLRFIEVGCGIGGFVANLAKREAEVIGLDVSPKAVHLAKYLVKSLDLQDRIDFIVGDAQFLPFKEQSGDIVVCSETLEHVPDYEKAFAELIRITRKSGYLCLTIPNFLSTAIFENVILLLVGQPNYVKSKLNVEKEHVFHLFKLKRLIEHESLSIVILRSTDFFHLPPRIRKFLKIDRVLKVASNRLENFFETRGLPFRLMGANIGVLLRKK